MKAILELEASWFALSPELLLWKVMAFASGIPGVAVQLD